MSHPTELTAPTAAGVFYVVLGHPKDHGAITGQGARLPSSIPEYQLPIFVFPAQFPLLMTSPHVYTNVHKWFLPHSTPFYLISFAHCLSTSVHILSYNERAFTGPSKAKPNLAKAGNKLTQYINICNPKLPQTMANSYLQN